MSNDIMERVPGTTAWVRATFTPKVQLKMREELRKMLRTTGALAFVVWLDDRRDGERIAFAGSLGAIPTRLPHVDETVATLHKAVVAGERVDLIVQIVQLGRGLPSLRVAAVDPESIDDFVMRAVEDCAARLEHIAVAAISTRRAA
jgi:hypothetical protein